MYCEKSIRLNNYWCYHPQGEIARIAPPAALTNGRITFGCLNNFSKVSEPALLTWCNVLREIDSPQQLLVLPPTGRDRSNRPSCGAHQWKDHLWMPEQFFQSERACAPHLV